MKLWEVIKELENGSIKTYEATRVTGTKIQIQKTKSGYLSLAGYLRLDYDWQPIPQTVTWQEAIQAWVDGKTIRIKNRADGERFCRGGASLIHLTSDDIASCAWYVED